MDYAKPDQLFVSAILLIGILFTAMTFYIFFNVTTNQDSISEKKRKEIKKLEQIKKIARLYPKKD